MENVKGIFKETRGQVWLRINRFVKSGVGTTWGWIVLILLLALVVLL